MKRTKGYILVITLLSMSALLFFGFIYADLYTAEQRTARIAEMDTIAGEAADAGIDDAIHALKRNASWSAGFAVAPLPHSGAGYSMSFDKNQRAIPYSTNNSIGSLSIIGYGGRIVPPGMVDLISVGSCGNSRRTEEAIVGVTGVIMVQSRW